MSTVVALVDGSLDSWVAINWCAQHLGAGDRVIGVHAAGIPPCAGMTGFPPISPYVCVDEDAEQRWLQPLREAGISCDLLILADQRLGALLQVVAARHPDLIVMAKAVRGTLHDVVAGDLSAQLVHLLPCPLLVLPSCRPPAKRQRKRRRFGTGRRHDEATRQGRM